MSSMGRRLSIFALAVHCCLLNECNARKGKKDIIPVPPQDLCWEKFGWDHDLWCHAAGTPYCQSHNAGSTNPCASCSNFNGVGTNWVRNTDYCPQRLRYSTIQAIIDARNPRTRGICEENTGKCYIDTEVVNCSGFFYTALNGRHNPGPELELRLVEKKYTVNLSFRQRS